MPRIDGRPGEKLAPVDFDKLKKDLQETYPNVIVDYFNLRIFFFSLIFYLSF